MQVEKPHNKLTSDLFSRASGTKGVKWLQFYRINYREMWINYT